MSCILKELIMVYRVVGSTIGNQDSTGCVVIQLSVVRYARIMVPHQLSFVWGGGFSY